ncbi:MAG: Na/Pi cotransporter family protein [Anaerolineales bacterium]|nr:Na/Pi cotransporter family protein [Anaerolineales bacterium]
MLYLLQVLGGLALFLFGVGTLSDAMEQLAGERIQIWLDRMTNRPIKGAVFGVVATALMQSSGLLMVTMIGLINANLMTLPQAVGVMMGQEIGTTLTAQMAAFRIGDLCYVLILAGFLIIEVGAKRGWRPYGEIIFGIGVLFLGMNLMSGALKVLTDTPLVAGWLATMGQHRIAGVLAGMVATAAVQSSSATTAVVVALGISGGITLPGAIAIILGANIGSCITGLMASLRLSQAARQASVAQILINVFGVLIFLPFITPFAELITATSGELPRQIANAHTVFNIAVSVVLFPFVRHIARLAERLVPKPEKAEEPRLTAYIDERQYQIPQVALQEAFRELHRLGDMTAQMIDASRRALLDGDITAAQWVLEQEQGFVDPVCWEIQAFVDGLLEHGRLSPRHQRRCFQIKNLLIDIERVGDLAQNLAEAAQQLHEHAITFSPDAIAELDYLARHVHHTYTCVMDALRDRDRELAARVCRMEDDFDALYLEARQGHINRIQAGVCHPEVNVLFVETLRNLERISDHADNVGVSISRN